MNNQTTEILTKAKELIETVGWTKYALATRENGVTCPINDPLACKFCAIGAMKRIEDLVGFNPVGRGPNHFHCFELAIDPNQEHPTGFISSISQFNDSCNDVEHVLAAFDRAIELSKEAS